MAVRSVKLGRKSQLLGRAGVLQALAARREGKSLALAPLLPAPARERMARRAPVKRILREYPFLHRWDATRYPESYLRKGLPEDEVQDLVIGYLRCRFLAEVTVIDSGDRRLRGRAAKLLQEAGGDPHDLVGRGGTMERGVVDLAVTFRNGRAGWFEVKRPEYLVPSEKTERLVQGHPAGEPTVEQLDFLERQHRKNAIVGVLWGTVDVDAVVPAAFARLSADPLSALDETKDRPGPVPDILDDLAYGMDATGGRDTTKGGP